ncbi:MAG: tetratricopeptide repeat protein [Desulfovibrionaceae bacterium]
MEAVVADVLELAADHLHERRMEIAAQACRAVLDVQPGHGLALLLLGSALLAQGDYPAAARELRLAVQARPEIPEAWRNLGAALRRGGRLAEAVECFEQADALRSPYPDALHGQALALKQMGRFDEARSRLRRALAAQPDFPQARRNLANLLLRQGRLEEALEQARACPENDAEAGLLAGRILQELDRGPEAITRYRQVLEIDPECARARLALAGLEGSLCPAGPLEHIRRIFDDNADTYDQQLLQSLEYRGHLLLAEDLAAVLGEQRGLSVLDAGCGSGLLGPLLAPRASRMVGVDLSERMLELARRRGCYHELAQNDVLRFAANGAERFDVLAAADLLCYLGDLGPVLAGLARCLAPGGLLAATLERLERGETRPGPSLRFAHSEAHLRRTAAEAGLDVLSLRRDWLRLEGRERVDGMVCVLGKDPLAKTT